MNKYLASISIILMASCNQVPPVKKGKTESLKSNTSQHSKSPNRAPSLSILGFWAAEGDQNATFVINKTTFNYPDQLADFKYDILKDSVIIHYDGYNDTFKVGKRGLDTLILSNKRDGKTVFHRFKD
jgi:hypothetical protein